MLNALRRLPQFVKVLIALVLLAAAVVVAWRDQPAKADLSRLQDQDQATPAPARPR